MTTSNGLALLDKPAGLTSHDVVARVRRILDERRVGHAGTLDPMATGLLVLGVGPSTRLLRFAQSEEKRYSGAVKFGVATDSLDADGAVTGSGPVPGVSSAQMNDAARSMTGVQLQTPPMVSALKVNGKRLHELARQGVDVEREPRQVTIHDFALAPTDDESVWTFDVRCSVGTYVRVLLYDLAHRLGTVGHLVALRRLSSGSHRVEDALTLDAFADAVASGASPLRKPSVFVSHLETVMLGAEQDRQMRLGQRLHLAQTFSSDEIAAMHSPGDLSGILRRRGELWQPEVVLPLSDDAARR